ncbi:MAG TPA: branched-chain amino acid ABC transporter permease [Dehalococcoidales bacterium]|jgi:branched-chain amino acid transport system permease protein
MENIIAQLISGLANGSIYALIVVGMTLLLLVRGIVHFGFAYIVIFTAYLGWVVLGLTDNNLLIAIPAFVIIGVILTVLTEPLFRPLAQKRAFLESMVLGQGIAILLTDVASHYFNYGQAVAFPQSLASGGARIRFGVVYFSLADVWALVGGLIAVGILIYFLYRSKQGRAIRAMAQDLDVARSLGIPFTKTGLVGFAISGALAGIVAILIAMTLEAVNPAMGDALAIRAMVLMLFAGMGNLMGGLVCALMLGVVEAMAQAFMPGRWTEAITFGVVMLVILARPNGVFGART